MKTVDNILCEMRKDIPRVVDAKVILRNYADRLEAAVKYQFRETTKTIPHEKVAVAENATTTPTCDKSSQVGNAPPMNINKINNYDEMVNAWNDYVRTYHHGMIDGFFAWLFAEAKGEEK
jgi:hypothetical protein